MSSLEDILIEMDRELEIGPDPHVIEETTDYQLIVLADKRTYGLLNKVTGVLEDTDPVLGRALGGLMAIQETLDETRTKFKESGLEDETIYM